MRKGRSAGDSKKRLKWSLTWGYLKRTTPKAIDYGRCVPGLTLMALTPFNNPAPAAFVMETPVDQSLDFFVGDLASRLIDGPRIDSASK